MRDQSAMPGPGGRAKMETRAVDVWYGEAPAIRGASLEIRPREITALMGPSGCGKSTFLRCLNRMNDRIPGARVAGEVLLDGADIYGAAADPVLVRLRVGMVAQDPTPFPKSVFENVAFGPRLHGLVSGRAAMEQRVEESLRRAGLWDEVKDRLDRPGTTLSGGQQQRLCIARAIANRPEVILMDEPCSALDPIATEIIEELMGELRRDYTVVIVTHNMEQAKRVSQRVAHFHLGELVEVGPTEQVTTEPRDERTRRYVSGEVG